MRMGEEITFSEFGMQKFEKQPYLISILFTLIFIFNSRVYEKQNT